MDNTFVCARHCGMRDLGRVMAEPLSVITRSICTFCWANQATVFTMRVQTASQGGNRLTHTSMPTARISSSALLFFTTPGRIL